MSIYVRMVSSWEFRVIKGQASMGQSGPGLMTLVMTLVGVEELDAWFYRSGMMQLLAKEVNK